MYPQKNSPNTTHPSHTRTKKPGTAELLRPIRIIPLVILLLLSISLAGTAAADILTAATFDTLHSAITGAPADGSSRTIIITQDIPVETNTTDIFTIAENQNITLTTDAASRKIYRTGAQTGGSGMFLIQNGGTLTLQNNGTDGILTLDGNKTGVTANTKPIIYIDTGSTFIMTGGIITANHADSYGGGGVHNNQGTFTMSGGTISGNSATYYGGGVFNGGTFTMSGGTISGNSANYGGGVYNLDNVTMSGGVITNNSAEKEGGEVCYLFGTFNLSGNAEIGPDTTMLFGGEGYCFTVPSGFTGTVTNITPFYAFGKIDASVDLIANATEIYRPLDLVQYHNIGTKIVQLPPDATAAYLNNFLLSPSLPGFALAYKPSEKSLVLARGYNLTVTGGTGSGSYAQGTNASITAIVPAGSTFENWTVNVSGGTFKDQNNQSTTYTMPAHDVEITATFKITSTTVPTATVTTKPTTAPATATPTTAVPTAPQTPAASSGTDGNMENAFRVLFDTQGGSLISPETGLSYGDRITKPANPVRPGYLFLGWYQNAALTTPWNFSGQIPGDITLYAGWAPVTPSAATTTAAAATPEATLPVPSAAKTATPAAPTTHADPIPTLTQAPAPAASLLPALIAAALLRRKRHP